MDLDDGLGASGRSRGEGGQEAGGGGWDDDLDLGDLGDASGGKGGDTSDAFLASERSADADVFVVPTAGTSVTTHWCSNSSHAADHAAAGSFETAMQLLNRQIAAVQFAPLKPHFNAAFTGAYTSLPCLPLAPSLRMPIQRNAEVSKW